MYFSIVVPMYNVEKYIERCIQSILQQGYIDYEIILVDDGSLDRSGEIAERYSRGNTHIQVIHQANAGLSEARNSGISLAQGDYIIFLDSDDYLSPQSLTVLSDTLEKEGDLDVLFAGVIWQEDSLSHVVYKENIENCNVYTGCDMLKAELVNSKYQAMAQAGVYRRAFLLEDSLWFKSGILHEDQEWSPRVALRANKVMQISFPFYYYIIRKGSITQGKEKTKNAYDLISTCTELKVIYETIADETLRQYLLCYNAKLYMRAASILLRNGVLKHIDEQYIMSYWTSTKDRLRFKLFLKFPRLYARIDKLFV